PVMEPESIFPLRERYHANLDAAAEELIARRRRISMASPYFHQSRLRLTHPDKVVGPVVVSGNPDTRKIAELRADYQLGAGPGMTWPCRSPWTFARILPTGDVELCFKFVVGNLRERAFKDIWFGEAATAVRARVIAETTICPACRGSAAPPACAARKRRPGRGAGCRRGAGRRQPSGRDLRAAGRDGLLRSRRACADRR